MPNGDGQPVENLAVIEYRHVEDDGTYWIEMHVDRKPFAIVGPFRTKTEREACHADLLKMMRQTGAQDLPVHRQ